MSNRKTLGVIGGLGPIATAHFLELVINMTDAKSDQEHLDMIIYNTPSIPDRTNYILDNTQPDPLPRMLSVGQALAMQGASQIAIPCMTAHYFFPQLEAGISAPIINSVAETVRHLKENGIEKVGLMATDGTIRSGIFHRELEKQGLCPIVPDEKSQADVMHLIFRNVKSGTPAEMDRFFSAADALRHQGAQAIILGCTELSLIKRDYRIGAGFLDAMEVLAQRSVLTCEKPLKEAYRCLITKN